MTTVAEPPEEDFGMDPTANVAFEALVTRAWAEYRDMPGLQLTIEQAARLWAIDRFTCQCVLERLVARGAIRITRAGLFALGRD